MTWLVRPWWLLRPAARAATVRRLRAGLRRLRRGGTRRDALAAHLCACRSELIAAQGLLQSCARCALHCDPPHGAWPGGFCCGGEAEGLFVEAELAGLAASGTRPADLHPPAGLSVLAGCVFRGALGCSLEPRHRPSICLAHLCDEAARELARAGRGRELGALADALMEAQRAFAGGPTAD